MLDMPRICADLQDEQEDLDRLLSGLNETDWGRETPAVGWTIRDQVRHIGATDGVATIAASQPERFATDEVRVELRGPRGALWIWGDAEAPHRISGAALDFCLVVIQRRHVADTRLQLSGPLAAEWMHLAQAFAGPPGAGRQPGQFPLPEIRD